jgi:hypothetical protein
METVFRNLINFEQCYPNCEARFTSYAILVDNLINSAKDADILNKNDITDNWFESRGCGPILQQALPQ